MTMILSESYEKNLYLDLSENELNSKIRISLVVDSDYVSTITFSSSNNSPNLNVCSLELSTYEYELFRSALCKAFDLKKSEK